MPFLLQRSFDVSYAALLRRPRVSYKISEYVFDFFNEQLLQPKNVMQSDKYLYRLTFHFMFDIPKRKFPSKSPFDTKTRMFKSQRGFETFEKTERWATMIVLADDIDQNIEPYEYATVIGYMLSDFLLNNFKKFTVKELKEVISQMDRSHIERFAYPARFNQQRYQFDDNELSAFPLNAGHEWSGIDKMESINPKVEYLKHYPF